MEHTFINTAANNVMLYLQIRHDFYNTVLKTKHKLYFFSLLTPTPNPIPPHPGEKYWVRARCCVMF